MERRNDDFWKTLGVLVMAAMIFISFAGRIANAMNLDLQSASYLLLGGLLAIAMFAGVIYIEMETRALAPWILVLVAPSLVPALKYWASSGPGPFHLRGMEQDMAWFGNGWWIFSMWLVLVIGAYVCNKLTDDWFRG